MSTTLKERLIAGIAGLSVLLGGIGAASVASADTAAKETVSGSLSWGLKQSFRSYVWGAGGAISASQGASLTAQNASGLFSFPLTSGQNFDPAQPTNVTFAGAVNMTAHGGAMDITLSQPVIVFSGNSGTLKFNAVSKGMDGNVTDFGQIDFATISNLSVGGTSTAPTIIATGLSLTASGAPVMNYPAGTALDDLSASLTRTVPTTEPTTEPTTGPTTGPTTSPTTGPTTEPTTGPTATPDPGTTNAYGSGALKWGIKSSFVSYISKAGKVTLLDGTTGTFNFPLLPNQNLTSANLSRIAFSGGVNFSAHGGVLDITVSQPIVVNESGAWVLKATASSKNMGTGAMVDYGEITIADLSEPVISQAGSVTTLEFTSATLNAAAVPVFGSYAAGVDMDLPTISLEVKEPTVEPTTKPTVSPTTKPTTNPTTDPTPTQPVAPVKECKVDEFQTRVTGGAFSWGIKESFTTYIRSSIANGGWNLSGASWNGSTFNFKAAGGLYNTGSRTGTLYYSGTVHFTGHNGVLDLRMSNPQLRLAGNSGTLYMNVTGTNMSGARTNYGTVAIANVTLSQLSVTSSKISFASSSVSLTATGAQAMAGFYKPGDGMDNFSGSANLVPNSSCDPQTGQLRVYDAYGKLAYTGASNAGIAFAGLALMGVGIAFLGRRRVKVNA